MQAKEDAAMATDTQRTWLSVIVGGVQVLKPAWRDVRSPTGATQFAALDQTPLTCHTFATWVFGRLTYNAELPL